MAEQNAKYLNKCRLLRVFEYMQNTDEQHPLNITQIIAKLLEDGVCDREPDRKSIMRDLQTIEACGYKLEACENHNDGKYLNYENKPFGCDQLKMLPQSIQDAFTRENGYMLIFDNARQKQANQIKAIRSFISQQVDYIVLSPIEESGWDTVLQEAKDAGIPVILIDRKVSVDDDSLYASWVGSDFVCEGQDAGYWLEDYMKKQGREDDEVNIVVLKGTKGASATIGRTRGFNEVAKVQRNWNILQQVDGEFTTAKGKEEMARLLDQYEDIDVVVSQNDDMTFGALEAIREAGKTAGVDGDITVISF